MIFNMKKSLFALDMDGVVADWNQGAANIVGYKLTDPKTHFPPSDWQKILASDRIFRDLPLTVNAHDFVYWARKFRDDLSYELVFLTAIPHYNDVPWAFWDKMQWAQRFFPDIPVHFGPYSENKQTRSGPNNILVDDRPDNCQQWQARGGTAIKVDYNQEYRAVEELAALYNTLSKYFNYLK